MIYAADFHYSNGVEYQKIVWPKRPHQRLRPYDYFRIDHPSYLEPLWESQTWPHCRGFRSAPIPAWFWPEALVLELTGKLPELLAGRYIFVSQRVRSVIEQIDDFGHQFHPMKIQNLAGEDLTEQPYYLMNLRRHIEVEALGLPYVWRSLMISDHAEKYIPTIRHCAAVRECLERFPLWIPKGDKNTHFFMNSVLLDALQQAGVEDLNIYPGGDFPIWKGMNLIEVYNQEDVDTAPLGERTGATH